MESEDVFKLVAGLVGGLGIFLLGMKNMSEGMQAIAGPSLRKMIAAVTNNRIFATGVGVAVTTMVQSSSVTTVMVVGFVNSGMMELSQAIGVIMGANIGTTITGWILVLKIGKYGLPILGVAAFTYLFSKGDRWRFWAMAIMGVGMVFFGLELMKEACSIFRSPDNIDYFESWFLMVNADTHIGVLKCALAGCLLTVLVQSSSATLAITISLAVSGNISYETAAALVLGENIGTTITAYLASLGATTNARRAAYFHIIFNILGVMWITAVFFQYIELVQWIAEGDVNQAVIDADGTTTYPNRLIAIALTHSIFNVANTLIFLPFLPVFVRFLEWAVPAKDFKEKPHLTDLDVRMLETPTMAIEQSGQEIARMGDSCIKMLDWLLILRSQAEPDTELSDRLKQREDVLDSIHDEIAKFVTDLLAGNIPHSVAEEARQQLRMADEYESVSDYIANLEKFDRKLKRDGHAFTTDQCTGLNSLNKQVKDYLIDINEALVQGNANVLIKTDAASKRIKENVKQLRRQHLEDLSGGTMAPVVSVAYLAALNAYSRVRDHSRNISESISGEK
ncbi:MAG: sodium:phosphate symporter [Blastopirellula sp.]|nr:MAG: sodium:phosphate symporter [Blastopirellula sp.]